MFYTILKAQSDHRTIIGYADFRWDKQDHNNRRYIYP